MAGGRFGSGRGRCERGERDGREADAGLLAGSTDNSLLVRGESMEGRVGVAEEAGDKVCIACNLGGGGGGVHPGTEARDPGVALPLRVKHKEGGDGKDLLDGERAVDSVRGDRREGAGQGGSLAKGRPAQDGVDRVHVEDLEGDKRPQVLEQQHLALLHHCKPLHKAPLVHHPHRALQTRHVMLHPLSESKLTPPSAHPAQAVTA